MKVTKNKLEIETMSPLTWAYIGDGVYELYIRTYLVNTTKLKPHYLHVEATKFVKASAQAEILHKIKPNLTEEELEIVRRTRNTQNHHIAKNASQAEYACSTAFEGLIGYLYLTGQVKRIDEIMEMIIG